MSPRVRVLMPCYNDDSQHLLEAIASLEAQSEPRWELVIVDDGSERTETKRVLEEIAAKGEERITIVSQSNTGPGAARNRAALGAETPYFLPLDSDDRISSDFISECVSVLDRDSTVAVAHGAIHYFGAFDGSPNLPPFEWEEFLRRNLIPNTAVFRRGAFEAIGGYDADMLHGLEDYEFFMRLLDRCGGEVASLPHVTCFYRMRDNSRNVGVHLDRARFLESLGRIVAKNGSAYLRDPKVVYERELALESKLDVWHRRYGRFERVLGRIGAHRFIKPI